MPHIEIRPPDPYAEGYLGRDLLAMQMQTQFRKLQREERQLKAQARAGQENEDLLISYGERAIAFSEQLIEFMAEYVTTVDGQAVSWSNPEDQGKIRWALKRASKPQIDQILDVIRGVDLEPPKS